MNFLQTLYINQGKDPFHDTFGWAAPEYHLISWALSCLQLYKIYGNVSLYGNAPAARLLIDTLQLPYTKAYLTHDELILFHPDLWALSKIHTYSLQEQPFLHIDSDAFVFQPFDSKLLSGELIAQNVEVATDYYYFPEQKKLMQHFTFFPPCVKRDFESGIPIQAVNAGILGGRHLSFFHDYAALAFDYVRKNANEIKYVNASFFNIFVEQHLFYALAKERHIPVNVLFERIINDNGYRNLGDFHEVPFDKSYLHLIGAYKRDELTCTRMATKLRELHPDYYERIIALFRDKNIRLSPRGFYTGIEQTDEQSNSHLQLLKLTAHNDCPSEVEKESFQSDFETFYSRLLSLLPERNAISALTERDLSAQHWYRDLFADASAILNQRIVRSPETAVIESVYNWAELFTKYYRVRVGYYSDVQLKKGQFFNLIVYEASDTGFSLYDIDETDHSVLLLLTEQLSVSELLIQMQMYFEDEVIQEHYEEYQKLILMSIKQLVINKAIQPVYDRL